MTGTAHPTVFEDNDRVRVTEWRFPRAGDNTGWHRHEFDYVVVPLFDGALELVDADGNRTRGEMRRGLPYFRRAGVEHDVVSTAAEECAFVEIEIKA
ncbi:cupin [Acuticoccus sp.]|uniref:cupin n=1 Tax=Acuticoccus sp. TaxID=1904378 RepID=UPI003B51E61E